MSLSDVADRLHIRSAYLAAIEAEDWQVIGPAVYVRGFIRNYAKFLGLDADAAVARFGGSPAGIAAATTHITPTRTEPSRSGLSTRGSSKRPLLTLGDSPKSGPSVWAVLGVIVAFALVAFVGYEYFEYQRTAVHARKGPVAEGSGMPAADVAAVAEPVAAEPTPELRASIKNIGQSTGFAVRLRDSSWLRVTVDGRVAMEGQFPAGTVRSFTGRSAIVRVGNAGGVEVTVDGKDLGPMGGSGDVAERSFQI